MATANLGDDSGDQFRFHPCFDGATLWNVELRGEARCAGRSGHGFNSFKRFLAKSK
jgi:hypothetical protein